jgi:hypothetical protein
MTIQIVSYKDHKFWYAYSVDNLYDVIAEGKDEYVVRDNEGYLNIVLKEDSRVVDAD